MSFKDCLIQKVESDDSDLTQKQADEFINIYDQLQERRAIDEKLSEMADQEIAERTVEIVKANKNGKKYQEMRQIKALEEAQEDMTSYRNQDIDEIWKPYGASVGNAGKRLKIGEGALGLLSADLGKRASYQSMEDIQKSLQAQYYGRVTDLMQEFKQSSNDDAKVMGRKLLRSIVDGEDVDPSTNAMAEAIDEVFGQIADDYRLAGGSLRILDDYFPNPDHDSRAILEAGKQQWIEKVKPKLDMNKMINPKTGQPMEREELDEFLSKAYDNITSAGDPDSEWGQRPTRALANERIDSRQLHFKSSKAWMEYNDEFGSADVFNSVVKYIDRMSRDIAMMRRLGPNPKKSKRVIEDIIQKKGNDLKDATNGTSKQLAQEEIDKFDNLYNQIMGRERGITNSDFDKYVNDINNVAVSATIGSAFLKAITSDAGFTGLTAWFNGMPATRAMAGTIKTFLDTAKGGERIRLAQEAQAVANSYKSRAIAQARYFNDIDGHGMTNWMADKTLKYSMMTPWTVAARSSWGLENLKFFRKLNDKNWDELQNETGGMLDSVLGRDDVFREQLGKYGVTKKDWEIFRQTPVHKDGQTGLELIRPRDVVTETMVEKTGLNKQQLRQVKEKFQRFILGEQQLAVPSVTYRARATLGDERSLSNPWARAIYKSFKMYKNFPITVWQTHMHRALQQSEMSNFMAYGSMLLATTTIAGGLGTQMSEIAKGREPRNMGFDETGFDWGQAAKFWGDSIIAGGGLGIFGDVLFRGAANPRTSLTDAVAGPSIGMANDAVGLTLGNAIQGLNPEQKMRLGRDASDFMERWTPGGNIWYSRLAVERGIFDNFQRMVDPKAYRDFRREEQRIRREEGQEWWSPPTDGFAGIYE